MDSLRTLHDAHAVALRLSNVNDRTNRNKSAVAVARAWPHLAVAAAHAGAAFNAADPAHTLDRIGLAARATHTFLTEDQRWPRQGRIDANRGRLVEMLHQVAGHDTTHLTLRQREEATRLLISIVWVTAEHSVRTISRYVDGRDLRQVQRVGDQITASGHLAAAAIHAPDPVGAARSASEALATWDIEAHRAMLATRSTLTLHAVAKLQADITYRLQVAMRHAGNQVKDIDRRDLNPVLESLDTVRKAWRQVAVDTRDLAIAREPLPPNLINAGLGLRDHLRAAKDSPAPKDQQRGLLAVHHAHLASMISLANTAHDLSRGGGLRAPSEAIERVLRERDLTRPVLTMPRTLPLPRELRTDITAGLHTARTTAATALHESFGLDKVYRSPAAAGIASRRATLQIPELPELSVTERGPAR